MPKRRKTAPLGQTDEIVRLYMEGDVTGPLSVRQIADRTGLTRWVVASRLNELGITLRDRDEALRTRQERLDAQREREERDRCPIQGPMGPCAQQRMSPTQACYYHEKLVRGITTPAPAPKTLGRPGKKVRA